MNPEARNALLVGLTRVVAQHQTDPVAGGQEAVRLLRVAGASWCDVLGPAHNAAAYTIDLAAYGYRMSPAADAIIKAGHAGKDAARALGLMEGEVSDRWVRHAIETPGYFLGLPTGQAAGAGQFLWDAWNGDENPQSAGDWLRGVMYGPAPRASTH